VRNQLSQQASTTQQLQMLLRRRLSAITAGVHQSTTLPYHPLPTARRLGPLQILPATQHAAHTVVAYLQIPSDVERSESRRTRLHHAQLRQCNELMLHCTIVVIMVRVLVGTTNTRHVG
jgi:hypothetical protein